MAKHRSSKHRSRAKPNPMSTWLIPSAVATGIGVAGFLWYRSEKEKKAALLKAFQPNGDAYENDLFSQYSQESYGVGYATSPMFHCVWMGAKDSNSNDSVTSLINALHDAGFAPANTPRSGSSFMGLAGKVDRLFDSNIQRAVISFQKAKGLKADGVVGPGTWKALGVGGWTGMNLSNCPRCAGKFQFGQAPPADCEVNKPPTQEELKRRIQASESPEDAIKLYEDQFPSEDEQAAEQKATEEKKRSARNQMLLIGVGSLLAIGGGVYAYKKLRK